MRAFVCVCVIGLGSVEVRDVEAQRTKDRENWAIIDGQNGTRLKKHVSGVTDLTHGGMDE